MSHQPTFGKNGMEQDAAMQQYFSSLPIYVQETIKQSGVCPQSVEELRQCAQHLTENQQ